MANPTLEQLEQWDREATEKENNLSKNRNNYKEVKKSTYNENLIKSPTLDELEEWDREATEKEELGKSKTSIDKVNYALMHPAHGKRLRDVFLGGAQSLVNTPSSIINAIKPGTVSSFNFAPKSTGTEEGKFLFDMVAPTKIGKAISGIGKVAELVPTLNSLFGGIKNAANANKLLSGTGQIARTGIEGGIGGAITNQEDDQEDDSIQKNALFGLSTGAGLSGAGRVAGAGLRGAAKALGASLDMANPFNSNLSSKVLEKNLEAAENTRTPIGDILGSPKLKKIYENYISPIPGSSSMDTLSGVEKNISNQGEKILSDLIGNINPSNIPDKLVGSLKKVLKETTRKKNNMYNKLDKVANDNNFKPKIDDFIKTSNKYKDAINSMESLKNDPELKSLLSKITKYEDPLSAQSSKSIILDKSGKKLVKDYQYEPSLKEATLLKSKIQNMADGYASSSNSADRFAAGTLKKIAKSLDNDIKNSLKTAPKAVKSAASKSKMYFIDKYSPNLEKEIYKYTNDSFTKKGDPDLLIKSLIKKDRPKLSKKLLSKLDQQDKNLIAYDFLKNSIDDQGRLNPTELNKMYKTLSHDQREMLLGTENNKRLTKFKNLVDLNKESLNLMYNPKTGNRLSGYAGIGGLSIPFAAGSAIGGIPGGAAAVGGTMLGARGLNNLFTSPKARKIIINMLKNPGTIQNKFQKGSRKISAYSPYLTNTFTGDE